MSPTTFHQIKDVIKLIFRGLLPLEMMGCGVALLFIALPGWSLIVGMPLIIIGMVFAIYTYDEVVKKHLPHVANTFVHCAVCHRPTPIFPGEKSADAICSLCREQIADGLIHRRPHR